MCVGIIALFCSLSRVSHSRYFAVFVQGTAADGTPTVLFRSDLLTDEELEVKIFYECSDITPYPFILCVLRGRQHRYCLEKQM